VPNLPPLPWLDEASFRRELEANYFTRDRPELTAKPLVALSGLYDVPWGSLSEAYGPAHFVPYFIEALSSPDADDRQWGLEALHASINHQGHPEEASLHAVPFLLEPSAIRAGVAKRERTLTDSIARSATPKSLAARPRSSSY
jgi:hypothetical protein